MSYFTTDVAAPINPATVPSGYTVEAFLKIDKDWTAQKHAWMNVMTRDGKARRPGRLPDGDPESPPLLFALSSLREVQWEVVPEVSGTRGGITGPARSSPTSGCTWPSSTTRSRMKPCWYIEGAPVLRNASNAPGLAALAANMPWIIGAGSWDGRRADGFFGSIGEIRIVGKALKPAQWLTARRA